MYFPRSFAGIFDQTCSYADRAAFTAVSTSSAAASPTSDSFFFVGRIDRVEIFSLGRRNKFAVDEQLILRQELRMPRALRSRRIGPIGRKIQFRTVGWGGSVGHKCVPLTIQAKPGNSIKIRRIVNKCRKPNFSGKSGQMSRYNTLHAGGIGIFRPHRTAPRNCYSRARREGLTAAVSLQSLIEPIIARGMKGDVEIVGPPGSGKSTALAHLAAVLPNQENIELCEEFCPRLKNISIVTRRVRSVGKTLATFFLAEWTIDDCMEYLAATHRDRARSVLARLSDDPTLDRLRGLPHLLCRALDRMAEDESIEHALDAVRKYVLGLARKKAAQKKLAASRFDVCSIPNG